MVQWAWNKASNFETNQKEKKKMSPNPRGLNNMSANNLILSNFPEQGSELVSEAKEKNRHKRHELAKRSTKLKVQLEKRVGDW